MLAKEKNDMNSIMERYFSGKRWQERRAIHREVSAHYEEKIKQAGVWRELLIRMRIEIEVEKEMKRKFPSHALYGSDFAR